MTYQDKKATKKPNHEKKKVRPYLLMGLRIGIDLAFLVMGLTSGASQRCDNLNPRPIVYEFGEVVRERGDATSPMD